MGRRKERRLAAMGAGRRVKLDLFAEPTGDSGGSSTVEEVGGDGDSKSHAELPDSPSSSGKQPQNPLSLLEQYSDEELDEDSKEVERDAIAEDASLGMDEQSKAPTAKINDGKDSREEVEEVEELLMDKSSAASQHSSEKPLKESLRETDSNYLENQTSKLKNSTNSVALDKHLVGDVNSGWKMVLHEESNQYYYWNVTTGETSWEVPDGLTEQTIGTSAEKEITDPAGELDVAIGTPLGTAEDDFTTAVHPEVENENSENVDSGTIQVGSDGGYVTNIINFEGRNGDANQDKGVPLLGAHSSESSAATDLSLQLIKRFESLLERLDSMKGLKCHLDVQDLESKCRLEIEIRLADVKALSSYESALFPFWLHSEDQLKRLEAAVACIIERANPASLDGFEAAKEHECTGDEAKIGSDELKAQFGTLELHVDDTTKKSMSKSDNDSAPNMECDLDTKGAKMVDEKDSELNHRPSLHSVEDVDMYVDMDMDMEVEDTSGHAGGSGAHYNVSVEPLDEQSTFPNQETKVTGHVSFPSDQEWIPPPPPDDEPFPPLPPHDETFPPPPPDQPPETTFPPSSFSSVQAIPYSGDYALSYPGTGLEYYVQTNPASSGSTLYTHSEGGQVPLSHLPHYYEAGPNIYPTVPAIVNPVEATSYHSLQNGTQEPVSLMHSTTESSGAKGEPTSVGTGASGSLHSHPEAGSSFLPENNFNADKSPSEVPEAWRSPATSSMENGAPMASTSDATASVSSSSAASAAAAAAAAAAAMKSQSKVSRTKKRTVAVGPSLRSNKKVSSMVDKWKAAKEELHEEDDEPKDAYEILEKKRQREIEQWRASQIASGEAKDNANFQPLGGDWRERVKRKRAQKMKESSPEVPADKDQRPDLVGLSKTLPSGWQAYWHESTKQVYYGNVLTSETTWTRPTA